eukprot:11281066-Prorocentrum_lima.AAC.1
MENSVSEVTSVSQQCQDNNTALWLSGRLPRLEYVPLYRWAPGPFHQVLLVPACQPHRVKERKHVYPVSPL